MTVKITPNDTPPGKLAEAELHFTEGPLDGLKLIGFSIWERRGAERHLPRPPVQRQRRAPQLRVAAPDCGYDSAEPRAHADSGCVPGIRGARRGRY